MIFDPGQCFNRHAAVVRSCLLCMHFSCLGPTSEKGSLKALSTSLCQVYYVNNDPEANDKLYVRWIGGVGSLVILH